MYSTAAEVIAFSGITKEDFRLDTDDELVTLLETYLVQCSDFIDKDRKQTFDPVPEGIDNIAMRMCSNMVGQMVLRRDSPIVKVDDFNTQLASSEVFTKDLKADLKLYPIPYTAVFRMSRVRSEDQQADDEAEE